GRTIRSQAIDAPGEAGRGLTSATFTGGVQFSEKSGSVNRAAAAPRLDVALKPAMAGIDDATFTRVVCFTDGGTPVAGMCAASGGMAALAATGRYNLAAGVLELSGTDRAAPRPHIVN